jgi:hypothetical protein
LGSSRPEVKEEIKEGLHMDERADGMRRGGDACIRIEGPVMGLNRRGVIVAAAGNPRGEELRG